MKALLIRVAAQITVVLVFAGCSQVPKLAECRGTATRINSPVQASEASREGGSGS